MKVHNKKAIPLPLLILVAGKPGSGKSTLALELGRAQNLGLPVLSRDALKAGLVETWAFARPEATREAIETDELRSSLVPRSFDLFYKTITNWLQAGTSLIAEYGFDQRTEPALIEVVGFAKAVIIHCQAADQICRHRFLEREQRDSKIRPDRLVATIDQIATSNDAWSRFKPISLPLPTLQVDTTTGYRPALPEICAFCRQAAR